jgi:outer membrane protein
MGAASVAQAQEEGKWMVRARAVYLDSANQGSTNLGGADLDLRMDNRWVPEVDISYFFTPNIAAELILTYPQKQTVTSRGLGGAEIGTFKHLPPTLTLQYHFTNLPHGIKPYVGAGINYTRFSDQELDKVADASIDSHSFGPALQLGVDVPITKNLYFNLDVKKVYIRTDVEIAGEKIGKFKADPILLGIGVGYRF